MTELDPAKAAAFAERLQAALNEGAFCLMASIGHRTGLFDAMRESAPSTSGEIARKAGLNERYVREWLGAMTTARVVELDPGRGTYRLPPEHAASLTRAAGVDNVGVFAQYVAMLGAVEDDVVECFRAGGGVPYSRYRRFHDVLAEDSAQSVAAVLETHVLPLVPGLAERLTAGARVADLGCGAARALLRLAELFPRSRFVGIDLSEEAIGMARRDAAAKRLRNVELVVADLTDFDASAEPDAFDVVTTFDAVHDQKAPMRLLKGIHRTLRADGVYLMQDIRGSSDPAKNLDHPLGTLLYTVSCMHCMTVSLAQGGEGLGAMWGEETTRDYLARAGFRNVETKRLAHDALNNWYVVRK